MCDTILMASRTTSPLHHPAVGEIEFGKVLAALSDPIRLAIVVTLAERTEVPCGGFGLAISKSTSSWHFRSLREAGVIRQTDQGTRRLNTLRRADLDARFPGLLDLAITEGERAIRGLSPSRD
jgi:DNA-binding transcriptional ArsR family regulator